jgi:hypothetical protein
MRHTQEMVLKFRGQCGCNATPSTLEHRCGTKVVPYDKKKEIITQTENQLICTRHGSNVTLN